MSAEQQQLQVQPTDESTPSDIVGMFNAAFLQLTTSLHTIFPSCSDFQKLQLFAQGVANMDNERMLIGVRLFLDYFSADIYPLVQSRNHQLWNYTTMFGVNMQVAWTTLTPQQSDQIWIGLIALVNAANVLGQIPQQRVVQLNSIIANVKDIYSALTPYLGELFGASAQAFGPGSAMGGQVMSMLAGMLGCGGGMPQ